MKSLRRQLTLRLLLGGALLLTVAGAALDWQMRRSLTAEFDASLRAAAQYLAIFTGHKVGGLKIESEGATLPQYQRPDSGEIFLLRTLDGAEVQRSHSLGDAVLPLHTAPPGMSELFDMPLPDGRAFRCAVLRFLPEMAKKAREQGFPPVEVALTVGRARAPLDRTLGALRTVLVLIGAGALGALVALVRWGVRGGLAPLDRLGAAVAEVDAATLATRFPTGTLPAELGPIAARLNELLARLEGSFQRERRFTANVAHELRTPLAELRALAEVNLATPATEEERAESWRDALATTRRMESVALRLLELARAEDPAPVVRRDPVHLDTVLREAWKPWAECARARRVELQLALPAGLIVPTDPVLLAVILGNLCGNAAEHAPTGTACRVTATREVGTVTVLFHNLAGGLTAADLPHLFERFWKKDSARADGRHQGLGLALAAEFATLLGGALTARLQDGGIEFAMRLPAE